MHTSLKGKVALVTGAAGALGENFSQVLARHGASVAVAGRRREPLHKLAEQLQAHGVRAMAVSMDVGNEASVKAGFDDIQDSLGLVDIVVNNAGVATNAPALNTTLEQWNSVIATNLTGCWVVATEAARRLVQAGQGGSIINISSILGYRVGGAVAPYTTAKAGLEQLTRVLALEWARYGIRVNAIAPGYVETDLNRDFFASDAGKAMIKRIPQRRLGQPQHLDGALLLLASEASEYMTGSSIVVDGGHLQSTL